MVAVLLLFLILSWTQASRRAPAQDALKELFRDPPHEYSMIPLWSWNATLTSDKLTWQIDQMVDKGVYGAFMHARAGLNEQETPYFSEGFWQGVRASVEHAEKTGFKAWIYDEDKWPSGAAGGRTMAADPERNTATGLQHASELVAGPARKKIDFPDARFVVAARLLEGERIDAQSLTNLTHLNEKIDAVWQVPPGRWHVCVFNATHGGHPLPNYLNPATVREFLNNTYEQYAARFGKHFGKAIPGSFFDEIGNIALAWDPILGERFRSQKGYDLPGSLPLLYHEGGPRTIKVRCDYFEVFAKLFEDAWFRQISEWCAARGLQLTGHTNETLSHIRGQGDYFRTWRHAQIPGTDNEDFRYTFPRVIGSWKPKQLSSVSHVYGKSRAAAEALGGAGWTITLDQMRYGVNMLAAYGMNFFSIHLFHYEMNLPQSMDDWPNSWFYQNPYWKYFRKIADHTRRLSFLGSQGEHVADLSILYPVEEVWSYGMAEPNPVPVAGLSGRDQAVTVQLVDRLAAEHLDFDLVDTDSIIASSVREKGRAAIGRESYQVLILPAVRTVSLAAYRRILELAEKGFKVAAIGAAPRHSAENGQDDPEVLRISEKLFGGGRRRYLAGDGAALIALLRSEVEADVLVAGERAKDLRYIHRRIGERDFYWLVNSENRSQRWEIRLAATGSVEKWNAENGEISGLDSLRRSGPHTVLDLEFQPWEAYYIVFDGKAGASGTSQPAAAAPGRALPAMELPGPWTLQLAPRELDDVWTPDPGETTVHLPVMDMRIEREGESSGHEVGADGLGWRRLKVLDTLNPRKGAARYLSAWDAHWITRYTYVGHRFGGGAPGGPGSPGDLAGPELHFSHGVTLPFEPSHAWLALAADGDFRCWVNEVKVAEGRGAGSPVTVEKLPLREGGNSIEIAVKGAGYLLAQGEIRDPEGRKIVLRTDRNWRVRKPGGQWVGAYEFTYPPFGVWGDLPLRGKKQSAPAVIWYRAEVPPGAHSIEAPNVKGRSLFFIDQQPLAFSGTGRIALPPRRPARSVLSLRVEIEDSEGGLQQPLGFRCRPVAAELGDWQELGLDWYSGRAVYRTHFDLARGRQGGKLQLDLGDLRYTGEVWINGKLVDSLAWPPYRVDISRFVHGGTNELVVVVANLKANEMRWNIFDSAIPGQYSRWWHDGSILREADHLRSGLLGPVQIRVVDR